MTNDAVIRQSCARGAKSRSHRSVPPSKIAAIAALLGAIGAISLTLAPSSSVVLSFVFLVLPLTCWGFITRKFMTSLVFTTLGEMYSGSNGTWLSIGPLSIRWALIFGTLAASLIVELWMWRPVARKGKKILHAAYVFSFGALVPFALFAIAMVRTSNGSVMAFQSLSFILVLLLYFPLRRALNPNPRWLIAVMMGLSAVLSTILLLMSVAPLGLRERMINNITGEEVFGFNVTGLSRQSSVQIVLLLFPIFWAVFEWTRAKSGFRKVLFLAAALFFIMPMAVTFLAGPLICMLIVLLASAFLLMRRRPSRRNGRRIVVAGFILILTTFTAAAVLTPDLLKAKLISRLDIMSTGPGPDEIRRIAEFLIVFDDVHNHLWLGQGAGATMTIDGSGPETGHTIEMEGLMTFHLFGLLGCGVLMLGIAAFSLHPLWTLRRKVSFDSAMAIGLALWATGCSIIAAGMINPYLTTPFPALFVALYLAWDDRVLAGSRATASTCGSTIGALNRGYCS